MQSDAGRFEETDLDTLIRLIAVARTVDEEEHWCNLSFEVDEDAPGGSGDSPLFSFLAARGPSNSFATVMGPTSGKRPRPAQVGIQHRAGPGAAAQLAEGGVDLPEGWSVVHDHPRRGLVVSLPADASDGDVARWLLAAMRELGRAPTTGRVLYELYVS